MMNRFLVFLLTTSFCAIGVGEEKMPTVRFATFNVSLNRRSEGQLLQDLKSDNDQAAKVAEIIQRVRPDVVLLNEFDFDAGGKSISHFVTHYLGVAQGQQKPIEYAYQFSAPVNTGVPSGMDLDNDGRANGPADAWGYGAFPGQYGMAVLSKYPFDLDNIRTFQKFLWKDMPDAARPIAPNAKTSFYSDGTWNKLRLSSKSHWDLPIRTDRGLIHFLVCHPTPPAFDGPEDRNGCRNHDEIRFWGDYIDENKSGYIYDDKGIKGGLKKGRSFVIAGDLNADPVDGGSYNNAIQQLLKHRLVKDRQPRNPTGKIQAERDGQANTKHQGNAEFDTSNFSDKVAGNLRVDYVLPSANLSAVGRCGIFWPAPGKPGATLVNCSDHRMVWIDIGSSQTDE